MRLGTVARVLCESNLSMRRVCQRPLCTKWNITMHAIDSSYQNALHNRDMYQNRLPVAAVACADEWGLHDVE